jgi:hypothetical protein
MSAGIFFASLERLPMTEVIVTQDLAELNPSPRWGRFAVLNAYAFNQAIIEYWTLVKAGLFYWIPGHGPPA